MKIGIHKKKNDFSEKWIDYCDSNRIKYRIVDCYSNSIVKDVNDCDALMWHFNQSNPKDFIFAKELLYSLQMSGKVVFPDFNTSWYFDDKVGQKYLLESINAPFVPSYVFYDKKSALEWMTNATFPKVFKLRKGAGSAHVRLVNNKNEAEKLIRKAFGSGFPLYNKIANLQDRWYKYKAGKTDILDVLKGVARLGYSTEFARVAGRERGYIYFQDFIPDNNFDIRVIVISGKAFAIKRMVRDDDFRASGSGTVLYEKHHFDENTIQLSFELAKKLNSQCLAIDYVYQDGKPLVVELSYGFIKEVYYNCEGYWDEELNWHKGPFNAQGWMIEAVLDRIRIKSEQES